MSNVVDLINRIREVVDLINRRSKVVDLINRMSNEQYQTHLLTFQSSTP
jgi:hypothetical protein